VADSVQSAGAATVQGIGEHRDPADDAAASSPTAGNTPSPVGGGVAKVVVRVGEHGVKLDHNA